MPIFQKIHRLERAQYRFLDHSKTLVFRDVIKIEILQVAVLRTLKFRFLRSCQLEISWEAEAYFSPLRRKLYLRSCVHGGGGPQVGEVTRLTVV